MAERERWIEKGAGVVRKSLMLRVKLTLTHKSANSGATAEVGDFYTLNCKTKGAPSFADASTWTDLTDNPDEPTGYAYAGKSEQIKTMEFQTRFVLTLAYDELLEHMKAGDVFSVTEIYDDPLETEIYETETPNCVICGLTIEPGDNGSESTMTIKLLPEGGSAENMPKTTTKARTGA